MILVFSLVPLSLSSLIIPQEHCGFQNIFLAALFCFFFLCCQECLKNHLEVYMQYEISHSLGCFMSLFLARSALRKDLSSLVCELCHFAICLCCSPSFTEKVKLSSIPCKSGQQPWLFTVPAWNAWVSVGRGSRSHPFIADVWSSPALLWGLALPWAGSCIRQYPRVASDLGCSLILSQWDRL